MGQAFLLYVEYSSFVVRAGWGPSTTWLVTGTGSAKFAKIMSWKASSCDTQKDICRRRFCLTRTVPRTTYASIGSDRVTTSTLSASRAIAKSWCRDYIKVLWLGLLNKQKDLPKVHQMLLRWKEKGCIVAQRVGAILATSSDVL